MQQAPSWINTKQDNAPYVNVKQFGAQGNGVDDDTPFIITAWNALKNLGGGTLDFPVGTYLTKDLLFQNANNFKLRGDRGSIILHTSNTTLSPGQATHNVCVIADCTDFSVEGLSFDARRDVISADQYLTSSASSGQKQIAVQDGTKYFIGQSIWIMGGLTANSGNEKNYNQSGLLITGINANTLTVNNNLTNTYTGTGANGGAWITQYQTGGFVPYSIAGRSLGNEDAQNGLLLLSCQRFSISNCTSQNTWESPIKMGTGFQITTPTDGCSYGLVTNNMAQHGYDQGISVWNSQNIIVTNNECKDAGWAGISLTHCSDCSATSNTCINNIYSPSFDLNEGTGVAVEGGVRCIVSNNICSSNNSNGIRLNISPLYGGAALSQSVSGSLSAGSLSITLSGSNSNFVSGSSFTIVDPNNNMIRETIYCTGAVGAVISISPALRNSYASGSTIYARFGEDVLVSGNNCALQALGAGIHCDQQTNLTIFNNDCSKNGFLNGSFQDTQGAYGIHLHGFCQQATVEANACNYNAQEGIVIDNDNRAVSLQANSACNNGIKGTNNKMGIKLYGPVDISLIGNKCNFNTHTGIYVQTGNANPSHTTLNNNTCMYNNTSGIWLDNVGTTIEVIANKIAYNLDSGIKVTGYADCVFSENSCYNQQGQEGMRFDDNGSNYCLRNKVINNHFFDDQGSPTQSYGLRELNHTANSDVRGNSGTGNTSALLLLLSPARVSDNVGYNPIGQVTAPTFPLTTVAVTNTTGSDITAFISNGVAAITVVQIAGVNGSYVTTGFQVTASGWGTIRIPAGGSVKFTYASGSPTWTWMAD